MSPEKMTHEEYIKKLEVEVVKTCNQLLERSIDLIWASRKLCGLRVDICEDLRDPDFEWFVIINNDTENLPASYEKHLWNEKILKEKEMEITKWKNFTARM